MAGLNAQTLEYGEIRMKALHVLAGAASMACAFGLSVSQSQATQIMVGQCIESAPCWTGPTLPWSDTLSLADLTSLGLGSTVPLIATQTSQFVIRLGVTTADFSTPGGPVVETVGEFNGPGVFNDPGPFPAGLFVGDFFIPSDATGLLISGTFGNSVIDSSSGVNVCLGSGLCGGVGSVPEASTWSMMLIAFAGLGFVGYRTSRKSLAVAA
jgi:hypothetical protein